MHGERMNAGDLQHIAFSEDPSPTGDRNGENSRVLVECIPSGEGVSQDLSPRKILTGQQWITSDTAITNLENMRKPTKNTTIPLT